MVQVVTVVGARPQFIKAAVVSKAVERHGGIEETIVHTGQHYDDAMSESFFRELGIPAPKINLEVGSGKHGEQTAKMLSGIEELLVQDRPDWVLVYGDTNSTLAAALAAAKLHVRVAHVEAGLRSFNRRMPEEVNRVVTDHVSDLLFAPTDAAVRNLANEGIGSEKVVQCGDVMYDVALDAGARAAQESKALESLGLQDTPFVLATVHRAENTDDRARLEAVFGGLAQVAEKLPVVLPLHPRTASKIEGVRLGQVRVVPPLGYLDMARLESSAAVVATDSGGVQKEAYFHKVPCVTLRDETEWVELVDLGWNRVCPPVSPDRVAETVLGAIGTSGFEAAPYGAGTAAVTVVEELVARAL